MNRLIPTRPRPRSSRPVPPTDRPTSRRDPSTSDQPPSPRSFWRISALAPLLRGSDHAGRRTWSPEAAIAGGRLADLAPAATASATFSHGPAFSRKGRNVSPPVTPSSARGRGSPRLHLSLVV